MRIDPEVVEVLRTIAEEEERSLSWVVNRFLQTGIKDYAGGLPPKESAE
jgi:hypothetical protein